MNVVIEAVRSLMDECEAKGVRDSAVLSLLSVIRGPDHDSGEDKNRYTAPLRLYLLGEKAYEALHFIPLYAEAVGPMGVPMKPYSLSDHYYSHIGYARQNIEDYGIRPASERLTT